MRLFHARACTFKHLNVFLDFLLKFLRMGNRHDLHHSLDTGETPVENDVVFFCTRRRFLLNSRESFTAQLFRRLLHQNHICLIKHYFWLFWLSSVLVIGALLRHGVFGGRITSRTWLWYSERVFKSVGLCVSTVSFAACLMLFCHPSLLFLLMFVLESLFAFLVVGSV